MENFTRGYLCKQCGQEANFKVALEVGTQNIKATGSCKNNHSWERSWKVGDPTPDLPIKLGLQQCTK